MENYKDEIRSSRKGCLGSSDASMLARIANAGVVPKSAYKRLAICKGLIDYEEIPTNLAMAFGDFIEMEIYKNISASDDRYLSNPLWVSDKFSRKNVKLISHPDIVLEDAEKKTLYIYEVKTTHENLLSTKYTYRAQMFVHYLLGCERVAKGWKVKVYLLHYDTSGLDLLNGFEFDPARLTKCEVRFNAPVFDVAKGMDLVSAFLDEFDEYYEGDEIQEQYLPVAIKERFDKAAVMIAEIKERERSIADFKTKLYDWMVKHDVKSLRGELFTITRVDASVQTSVDYKLLFEQEIAAKTPTKARKLAAKYKKESQKKGYVLINEKTNKEEEK